MKTIVYQAGNFQNDTEIIINDNSVIVRNWWYGGRKYDDHVYNLDGAKYLSEDTIRKFIDLQFQIREELLKAFE